MCIDFFEVGDIFFLSFFFFLLVVVSIFIH